MVEVKRPTIMMLLEASPGARWGLIFLIFCHCLFCLHLLLPCPPRPIDRPVCEGAGPAVEFTVEMCGVERKEEGEGEETQETQQEENQNQHQQQQQQLMESQSQTAEVYHGGATECTVGSLLPGATYTFRVRAANDGGVGHVWYSSNVICFICIPYFCREGPIEM